MAYRLQPNEQEQEQSSADESEFRVSADPLVENRAAAPDTVSAGDELPHSYGTGVLTLMPRDPYSLFAYWDIDWQAVFGERRPADRKVHLRVLDASGAEETSIEVEPMSGSCYVDVRDPDASYSAELGYFQPLATWNLVATAEAVRTPPAALSKSAPVDFATVPFHLSFQRMLDVFRVSKHESGSLTEKLNDLRTRATTAAEAATFTLEEHEIARAIDAALASSPAPQSEERHIADTGVQQHLERILGLGSRGGSSPAGGFGGSSRAW